MSNASLAIERITLQAGIERAVYASGYRQGVVIGNAGTTDMICYTTSGDDLTTVVIGAGWERAFTLASGTFDIYAPVFWLKCSIPATAVLIWV
jgi:hypothetical protein